MNDIAKRILDAMREQNLSYAELSKRTGIPKSALQRYATGTTPKIPMDRIEIIADALNLSAASLMGWEEALMLEIREETQSGRMAAKEEMYRTFGVDYSASDLRVIGDKTALLYYKAFERHSASELWDLIRTVDTLDYHELDNIRMMVRAYLKADPTIKEIVDTALKSYKEKESIDALIG